jgi:SAM-dependent methyltransferase
MLPKEAEWLGRTIRALDARELSPMLNIGSSTGAFVTKHQPWIDAQVFRALREKGVKVVNCDMKNAPGVDLVGDLGDPSFLVRLSAEKFKSVLCTNLLEHVENRVEIARTLASLVARGGRLLVSGPHRYPYHPDPIDTMFRPSVAELAELFPETRMVFSDIVPCGTYLTYVGRTKMKLAKTLIRILLPFYAPRDWYSAIRRLAWLNREFEVVCLCLEKM